MDLTDFFLNPAFIWFFIGLLFLVLEMVMPGIVIIFFGIGAWVTAISCLIFDLSLNSQILVFVISSTLFLLALRKTIKNVFFLRSKNGEDSLEDEFIGRIAEVVETIETDRPGKIIFKGARWEATSDDRLETGTRVEIVGKDSIVLKVTSIKK